MRIIVVGQAPFGKDCLEALLGQGENVVGVITVPDDPRGRPNPVKDLALEKGIPLIQPEGRYPHRLGSPEVAPWARDLRPDLFVLVFVTDFMPLETIKIATHGGINYHPSLLPKYRGGTAINWAVINGEKVTGVSIHYIDQGVDTGDIILQEKVTIEPEDTVGSVYFDKLYPLGVKLIKEAVALIREGKARGIPQDESQASFQPVITGDDVKIDWGRPLSQVYDLVRGSTPSPGAHTLFRGERLVIWDSRPREGVVKGQEPGRVTAVPEAGGFEVAAGDGRLLVTRVQLPGKAKLPAEEFIQQVGLKPGEKLG